MKIWGQNYSQRELQSYAADLRQIADIRLATLDDGMERGVRIAHVRTGSGLDFDVLIDRAMDIGTATYNGIPIAWQSGTGAAHPSRYEPEKLGWLRTFHGGLLALCGLTQAGVLAEDFDPENGEKLGLHGRIGTTPAYDVRIERTWDEAGQDWQLHLAGTVDEVVLFGYRLRLERRMTITPGQPTIHVKDTVRNIGGIPSPLMVVYHCNIGFPIVSPDSTLKVTANKAVPRDPRAAEGVDTWSTFHEPVPGFAEQVYFHEIDTSQPSATAQIMNHKLGVGIELEFMTNTLNYFTEWKQMGYGDYVVGIEPGNCLPEGRVTARKEGRLQTLQPGDSTDFELKFRVVTQE